MTPTRFRCASRTEHSLWHPSTPPVPGPRSALSISESSGTPSLALASARQRQSQTATRTPGADLAPAALLFARTPLSRAAES
eukprot:1550248-Rhodomonas_salina.3